MPATSEKMGLICKPTQCHICRQYFADADRIHDEVHSGIRYHITAHAIHITHKESLLYF